MRRYECPKCSRVELVIDCAKEVWHLCPAATDRRRQPLVRLHPTPKADTPQ